MIPTVVHYTDSTSFGGAEQVMLTLLRGLDKRLWRPVLLHHGRPDLDPLIARARRFGVTVREFSPLPGRRDVGWLLRFRSLLRQEGTRLFHAHLFFPLQCTYGLVGAALARVRVVASQHLFGKIETVRSLRLQKAVSMAVDRYIAVSEHLARDLRPHLLSAGKVQVIHNGIPLESFDRPSNAELRCVLTGGSARPIVLALARLTKQKGLRYLIEAAVSVGEAVFVIGGEGPERSALEAEARAAGVADRVIFLGQRDDAAELLAACDVFVLPSLFEGLPLSVLEAMAAGKPVVATAIGGTDEAVLHGETGLLVPPCNPAALAAAIRTVLADPPLARRLGEAGKARAHREFSAGRMVSRTARLYEELLAPRGESPDRHA